MQLKNMLIDNKVSLCFSARRIWIS